jgi:hypothetical protein
MEMRLRIKGISAIADYEYEAQFEDEDGKLVLVRFEVSSGEGPRSIQVDPDIFMPGQANARDINAVVAALHQARLNERQHGDM